MDDLTIYYLFLSASLIWLLHMCYEALKIEWQIYQFKRAQKRKQLIKEAISETVVGDFETLEQHVDVLSKRVELLSTELSKYMLTNDKKVAYAISAAELAEKSAVGVSQELLKLTDCDPYISGIKAIAAELLANQEKLGEQQVGMKIYKGSKRK